jgi:2-polyprenyl-6-methoxyphenol hydroxylase-like FAD-dependent oxidoreductase
MHITIIGSGPVGMTAALLLARQGHRITLIDRDPGPVEGHEWERVGVMQFHLPHGFRFGCRSVLTERLPDVFEALLEAGVVDGGDMMHSRRSVFERAMWEATSREPGIERTTGHVGSIEVVHGTATGVEVDSGYLESDLVIDASGRNGRPSAAYRPQGHSIDCGMAYAARQYALRPGATPGPLTGGPGLVAQHHGFFGMLFVQDAGTFTVLFVRRSQDKELAVLRDTEAFEAATRLVPGIADWVDPARSVPIDKVRAGAGLFNSYLPQPVGVAGLLAIGDAVCTTNPQGARGVMLGMQSAVTVADLVASAPPETWAAELDAWCAANMRCWYDEHLVSDAYVPTSWLGEPIDLDRPIPWDLVSAAVPERPDFMRLLGPFFGMHTQPRSIDPLREQVREMLRNGWRPAQPPAPTREDLVAAITPLDLGRRDLAV